MDEALAYFEGHWRSASHERTKRIVSVRETVNFFLHSSLPLSCRVIPPCLLPWDFAGLSQQARVNFTTPWRLDIAGMLMNRDKMRL